MKTKIFMFLAIGALAFTGCKKDEPKAQPKPAKQLQIEATITGMTRATESAFEAQDKIGMYVATSASVSLEEGATASNLCWTYDGSQWTAATPLNYPTIGAFNLFAYYPYAESGLTGSGSKADVSVAADQSSDEAMNAGDILVATKLGVMPSDQKVALPFVHAMSKVEVKLTIKNLDDASYEEVMAMNPVVAVKKAYVQGTIDMTSGQVGTAGQQSAVTLNGALAINAAGNAIEGVSAILIPQRLDAGALEVTVGDRTFSNNKGISIQSGKIYTVNVELDMTPDVYDVNFTVTVKDWTTGAAAEGEFTEEFPEVTSLCARGTSNCYIVSQAGKYMFDGTVQGNGFELTGAVPQEMNPQSAGVLWRTSEKSPVTDVYIRRGNIYFTVPEAVNDNVVIAAYDADGKTLWSWHIWLVKDYDPEASLATYYLNGKDEQTVKFMDRNLGATCVKADVTDTTDIISTFGMLYQWGRKDPFTGTAATKLPSNNNYGQQVYIKDAAEAADMPTVYMLDDQPSIKTAAEAIAWSIANPETYMSNKTWGTKDVKDEAWANVWGYESDHKSIYDPCPVGYRVPAPHYFTWSEIASWHVVDIVDTTNDKMSWFGMYLRTRQGGDESHWWPAPGRRAENNGRVEALGQADNGTYYLSSRCSTSYGYMYRFEVAPTGAAHTDANLYPNQPTGNWWGGPVRCVKE